MLRLFSFVLRFNAAGAGLNAFAVKNGVLQIRQESDNGRSHGVGSFDGTAVGFTANGAHSGHIKYFEETKLTSFFSSTSSNLRFEAPIFRRRFLWREMNASPKKLSIN